MDRVRKLRVQHVRTHADITLEPNERVTVITGANGSGKTSLIEALYVALQGSSFKGSDGELLSHGEQWYRVDIGFESGATRIVKFEPSRPTGRKQFIVDGKTNYRLLQQYKYPVVLFDPDDLRLLHGSPTRRRQFIDRFISQLDLKYALAIRRYERILKQRNTLLKAGGSSDSLFVWNLSLSESGAYIVEQRIKFINELDRRLQNSYRSIAHKDDTVSVGYSYAPRKDTQQQLLAELHASENKDRLVGFTSTGPHRHDVLFFFNDSPAIGVASRGEVRSMVLGLKFLEVEIIAEIVGKPPIILLDDVFSELDETRQANLASGILQNQTIITTTSGIAVKNATMIDLAG